MPHDGRDDSDCFNHFSGEIDLSIAFQNLLSHLDEHGLRYRNDEDSESVFLPLNTDVATVSISAHVEESLFQVFGGASIKVPVGCRQSVAETITRANFGLKVGKFEMDFEDGELRFQASTILPDDHLPDEITSRLITTVLAMIDGYLPAVMSVIFANEPPQEAIRRAEASP
jgi:hypothetical protein